MKWRRVTAFCLAFLLTFTGYPFIAEHDHDPVRADEVNAGISEEIPGGKADRYFYDQLSDPAKVFYDAMAGMYEDGTFKTGTESVELTGEGALTQEDVAAYMDGQAGMLADFGAARDAFYMDYPGIFYVDFSELSIRVTTSEDGTYHVYVGTGRYLDYYTDGFESAEQVDAAIAEYDAALAKVVSEAKKLTADKNRSLIAAQVEFVHDWLTNNVSYKLENACKTENIPLIRTAFGALVRGEAVCEGYSRALKAILDELEIPCVLVQGGYLHTVDVVELHMWNYAQIGGKWYGVDATMDDPVPPKSKDAVAEGGVDGYETHENLLVGALSMSSHYGPSNILSEANYPFAYPELDLEDYGVEVTEFDNGLTVKFTPNSELEGIEAGKYTVSFRGMGYAAAAEAGYYMLNRFYTPDADNDGMDYTDWFYIRPELYDNTGIQDSATELVMYLPQVEYIEFGVTEIVPRDTEYKGVIIPDSTYYGDPFQLVATSGMLYNPSGTYVAPPYPQKTTPGTTSPLNMDAGPYNVEIVYNEDLKLVEGQELGIRLESWKNIAGGVRVTTQGAARSKIENVKWDGKRTVTFTFTPSKMWADDSTLYDITPVGLVGVKSGKTPVEVRYGATNNTAACAYRCRGYYWNLFAQPTLIEDSDLSTQGWVTSDGQGVDEMLKDRIVLVATSPSHDQTDAMNSLIEDALGEKVLSSQTFNISLTVCKAQVVQTGQSVRIMTGFPEGYGPDDEGVTFKAYHFVKDDQGNTTDVEEISCTVTQYGLLIICQAFSPFAIVAVESDGSETIPKTVILSSGAGGSVTSENGNVFTVNDGGSAYVTIKADEGYVIDTVTLGGTPVSVGGGMTGCTLTLDADDLAEGGNILDVAFVAKEIQKAEAASGETAVPVPAGEATGVVTDSTAAEKPSVVLPDSAIALEGSDLVIRPTAVSGGETTYQWFKDGAALEGQTDSTLRIPAGQVNESVLGAYTLRVIAHTGSSGTITATSNECKVDTFIKKEDHVSHVYTLSASSPYNKILREPTCTVWGQLEVHCEICDAVITSRMMLQPLGHAYEEVVTEPTCTGDGSRSNVCRRCGDTVVIEVIPAAGHDWEEGYTVDWEPKHSAGVYEPGMKSIHCKNCDTVKNRTVIFPEHGVYLREQTPATCTEDGKIEYRCTICGLIDKAKTETISATGHSFGDPEEKEATCTEDGYRRGICSVCEEVTEEIIPATGHDFGQWTVTDSTCTADGERSRVCEKCGETETETIAATGHSWGAWEGNTATCTKGGQKTRVCESCGETETRSTYPLGHDWGELTVVKEARCESEGLATHVCGRCGTTGYVYPAALGHDWESEYTVDVAPSCVAGKESIHCARCGKIKAGSERTIPATDEHVFGQWTVTRKATCTEVGTETGRCEVCGNATISRAIPATGHSFGQWTVTKEPTDTENGEESRTCENCGLTETREITVHLRGDLNDDGVVDTDDALYLLMYTFFQDDYALNQDCDFNGDGVVDDNDALYLLMHVYFPEEYPLP